MSIPNNLAWSYAPSTSKDAVSPQSQMFNPMATVGFRSQVAYPRMPAPSGVPWTTSEMPWIPVAPHPNVVNFMGDQKAKSLHTKRKSDFDADFPRKKHITEEKMAAQLNSLHISSNYVPTATSFQNYNMDDRLGGNEEEDKGTQMTIEERLKRAQQLILCEEMKKLENEPLIPKSLLERLEKPCMSLVLWKPPPKPNDDNEDDGTIAEDNNNNPESSTSNQPIMDIDM